MDHNVPRAPTFEMNATKAFVKLNWPIFLSEIAKELGYNTVKSLGYIERCSDHHKSWRFLEIVYISMTDELLVPYVRHCLQNQMQPSVSGYWAWNNEVDNPNYTYMQQMVFTFLHSIMLFRAGVRNSDSIAINTGKAKLAPLFFARNHPKYRWIITLDRYMEVLMKKELKVIADESKSVSRTGNAGHYQGGDACLEEINKQGKEWVPGNGVPREMDWLKIFRNLDK